MASISEVKSDLRSAEHTAAIKICKNVNANNVVVGNFGRKAEVAFQAAA